jgi:hypothetical protein
VATVNVGTMTGRANEVVEMIGRRQIDFCSVQETRWKGEGTRRIEGGDKRYKFFWKGCNEVGGSGVGILVAEKWVTNVVEVRRISERIMVLKVAIGKQVFNIVSAYAPQAGRSAVEKESFWMSMMEEIVKLKEETVFVCGDMNGHVGRESDGYHGIHGGHGYGQRNEGGEMLLEFAAATGLVICNTLFVKDENKLITYESGDGKSAIDFVLVRKSERPMVSDVKVINGEACLTQHKLVICKVRISGRVRPRKDKLKFVPKVKIWKLKKKDVKEIFREEVESNMTGKAEDTVEEIWNCIKGSMVKAANKVCGMTKGKPARCRETWWWSEEVSKAVKAKRRLFLKARKSKSNVDKAAYKVAKNEAKKVIASAKDEECRNFGKMCDRENRKGNIFKVAKQIMRKNKDVVGSGCVKNKGGVIVTDEGEIRDRWKEYFDQLLNEEYDWDRCNLTEAGAVCGPSEEISEEEVFKAVGAMKNGKAGGPSGVVSEMLKASGSEGIRWMTTLFNKIISEGKIPEDWRKSWMIPVYKGKGDALECSSHRGIKLLDHAMKVFERVLEKRIRSSIKIDDQQFGFRPGRGTTDAIFIIRQIQEKFLGKKKELWMAFVDLEKAFDRVPREVLWWALRSLGLCEWMIKVVESMYDGVTTAVKVNGESSSDFEVKVGVHQGSVLSPLLFIAVIEAVSRKFKVGLPWELLYADDLALLASSEEELLEKIRMWKTGLEDKGLRVNVGKTKVMRCTDGTGEVRKSGRWPCGVCGKGVGGNSIECGQCKNWIHKRCSKIKGKIESNANFKCAVCIGGRDKPVESGCRKIETMTLEQGVDFECVRKFCYLGDMISETGGAGQASVMRVNCAWQKFRELSPILTVKGVSLKLKGKLYKSCVQSVMLYGSETWPMKVDDTQRLVRAERMMVRWMCGVTLRDRVPSEELLERLDVVCVTELITRGRLRWFGHVERKEDSDWVKACQKFEVIGKTGRGRNRKTWMECINKDLKDKRLNASDAQNREAWRGGIMGKSPTRACMEKRTLKDNDDDDDDDS